MENKELLEKAKQAKDMKELLALAKENHIELSEQEAKDYFEKLNKSGELSDDELDNVSGGGCHNGDGRLVVTIGHLCSYWKCNRCGSTYINQRTGRCSCDQATGCGHCKFMSYEKGLWLCSNENNIK